MIKQPKWSCELQEGTWLDFRDDVKNVAPGLFKLIESISPNKKYKLIKAKYLYGEKITDLGTIRIPNEHGQLVRLDDPSISPTIRDQLNYCPTPLMLQLTNASEVFVELEERIVPLNVFNPGDLYGLYEALTPFTGCSTVPCWSITSGGRSVFLAAKVSDAIGHNNLRKEFKNVPNQVPKTITDQWQTIKAIVNNDISSNSWRTEVLIFTSDWFKERKNDINWLNFYIYLYKKAWVQSHGNRVQIEYSIMWESFAKAICKRNLKPNSYIADTVKHLLLLATGQTPGFSTTDSANETLLPVKIIEKAYSDIYGLDQLAAIVMQPQILTTKNNNHPIYYSMAYATLLNGTPSIRKANNILSEVRQVQTLMRTLEPILQSQEERIYETIKNVCFEYFHSDDDHFGDIKNGQIIAETDPIISSALNGRFKDKKFPSYGTFFRGCIRISKQK
jgi:hypothetical protein